MEVILQIGLVTAMGAYLWQRRVDLNQRNRESGEELLARLKSEMGTKSLLEGAMWLSRQRGAWDSGRRTGWRELWKLYRHAGLLLRLADRADGEWAPDAMPIDPATMIWVRRNAMQARVSALTALAGYAFQR